MNFSITCVATALSGVKPALFERVEFAAHHFDLAAQEIILALEFGAQNGNHFGNCLVQDFEPLPQIIDAVGWGRKRLRLPSRCR